MKRSIPIIYEDRGHTLLNPTLTQIRPGVFNEVYDAGRIHTELGYNTLYVFGSNLAGIHGRGGAYIARRHFGAKLGTGVGRTGQAYAIPTKDEHLAVLPLDQIAEYIQQFKRYVKENPKYCFFITPIGCGLAGYKPHQIAPYFRTIERSWIPDSWIPYILL